MSSIRRVKSLIGAIEAEVAGEEWEFETPSIDFLPGMGLGATTQATRWAYIGYLVEQRHIVEAALKRPVGRPTKDPIDTKDAFRAYVLWQIAKNLMASGLTVPSNRKLMQLAMMVENHLETPISERAFPPKSAGTYDASVSRGKKALGIDDAWNSDVCEEIARN